MEEGLCPGLGLFKLTPGSHKMSSEVQRVEMIREDGREGVSEPLSMNKL